MKPLQLFILACWVSLGMAAQNGNYGDSMLIFRKHFNENNEEAVFNMFDSNMQTNVPLQATKNFISQFREAYGIMERFEFQERKDRVESYLGHFVNGKLIMHTIIDTEGKIAAFQFESYDDGKPGRLERNLTNMQLPFKGEWFTFWGGETKAQNYHVAFKPQQGAFDFFIVDENYKSYQRSGTRNEDYYAFGKPLYAVCDAVVFKVTTGVEDNRPTQMNPAQAFGNSVTLRTDKDEYIVYAHFQKGSIKVKEGDLVKQGQYLGNCGNSGNSSEAHLHLHIQDGPNNLGSTGARCFFSELIVNGALKRDYSPVKGDKISMPKE
ncbi:MAG: peptidoglycan DD-metalloendopeptidase family protein [Bacteroidota bacterium]